MSRDLTSKLSTRLNVGRNNNGLKVAKFLVQ